MGGNDKCVVAFGKAHTQFIADFIGKLGGYFSGLKGLTHLIGNDIAYLFSACNIIILPLREHKLALHCSGVTFIGGQQFSVICRGSNRSACYVDISKDSE